MADGAARRARAAARAARLARAARESARAGPPRGRGPEPVLAPRRRALDAPPDRDRAALLRPCCSRSRARRCACGARSPTRACSAATRRCAASRTRSATPRCFDPGGASSIQILIETGGPLLEPESAARRARATSREVAALPGVAGLRTPLLDLDPDARRRGALARGAASAEIAPALARSVDGDLALVTAVGAHPWRSEEAAADRRGAARAIPHPGLRRDGGRHDRAARGRARARCASTGASPRSWWSAGTSRSCSAPSARWSCRSRPCLMNVLSLGASYGILVWVFQEGHLSALARLRAARRHRPDHPARDVRGGVRPLDGLRGVPAEPDPGGVAAPARQPGQRDRGPRAHRAASISSAALILFVVIGAFAAGDLVYVKELGVGMGAALLLDVTLVRALLVPATMQLLGRLELVGAALARGRGRPRPYPRRRWRGRSCDFSAGSAGREIASHRTPRVRSPRPASRACVATLRRGARRERASMLAKARLESASRASVASAAPLLAAQLEHARSGRELGRARPAFSDCALIAARGAAETGRERPKSRSGPGASSRPPPRRFSTPRGRG